MEDRASQQEAVQWVQQCDSSAAGNSRGRFNDTDAEEADRGTSREQENHVEDGGKTSGASGGNGFRDAE
jgi:hypothetical protein